MMYKVTFAACNLMCIVRANNPGHAKKLALDHLNRDLELPDVKPSDLRVEDMPRVVGVRLFTGSKPEYIYP